MYQLHFSSLLSILAKPRAAACYARQGAGEYEVIPSLKHSRDTILNNPILDVSFLFYLFCECSPQMCLRPLKVPDQNLEFRM
uniref:Uncharacterized protein n=1 Tax=Hordeum vulgare subsp. vulgare TaxID=112509 RepID=A0A8I6WMG8_HORVV